MYSLSSELSSATATLSLCGAGFSSGRSSSSPDFPSLTPSPRAAVVWNSFSAAETSLHPGSFSTNSVSSPLLSSSNVPPCIWASERASESPSPMPSTLFFFTPSMRENGLKMHSFHSSLIASPSLRTESQTMRSSDFSLQEVSATCRSEETASLTSILEEQYFSAFVSRLLMIFVRLESSA